MYGIYSNIWGILMVNVTTYTIHGSYGYFQDIFPNILQHHIQQIQVLGVFDGFPSSYHPSAGWFFREIEEINDVGLRKASFALVSKRTLPQIGSWLLAVNKVDIPGTRKPNRKWQFRLFKEFWPWHTWWCSKTSGNSDVGLVSNNALELPFLKLKRNCIDYNHSKLTHGFRNKTQLILRDKPKVTNITTSTSTTNPQIN